MKHLGLSKVLIRNKTDGRYLILRSSEWLERPDRSLKPDLPGGQVDPGEDHYEAAVRELQEEAGIVVKQNELRMVYAESFIDKNDEKAITRLIFFAEVIDPVVKLSWEHDSYTWMSASEVLSLTDMRKPYPEMFKYLASTDILV